MRVPASEHFAAVLAFIAISGAASAQTREITGTPQVRSYSPKEYSGNAQVWTILRDRRGLLYIGTEGAIHQYDGAFWRDIPTPTVTRSLALDDQGRIWVGAGADFGFLEPDSGGAFKYVSLLDKVPVEHRGFTDVWQILITPKGNFFRSYERLFRWDGKHMQIWASPKRFQALSEIRGRIYTAQTGIGLEEIVGDELRPAPGGEALSHAIKLSLHPWDEQHILISSRAGSLALYDGQKVSPFHTEADDYLKANEAYIFIPLTDGGFCITTLRGGAVIIEHDGRLRRILDKESGLTYPGVLSAYQDRDGALWLGLGRGVARVAMDSPLSILSDVSASDTVVWNGTPYVASGNGGTGLLRLEPDNRTGLVRPEPLRGAGTQGFTLLVFHDPSPGAPDQLLAAGTNGVVRIQGDTVSPALPGRTGVAENAFDILQSRKHPNRVYIGQRDCVSSMRWEKGKWIDEGRVDNAPYSTSRLAEDADGTLWVGTRAKSTVLRFEDPAAGLRSARMEVLSDKDGVPAAGTSVYWAAGQIFAASSALPDILRWDAAKRKFVRDDRFRLPLVP